MTWEDIIKLRQGPLREKDAKRLKLRTSPDKKERDKAYDMGKKERTELTMALKNAAITVGSAFAREEVKIIGKDGRESKNSYRVLANLMERIADLYMKMYGDVDRLDNQDQSIASSNIQGDEFMRQTAAKFREVAQTFKKK